LEVAPGIAPVGVIAVAREVPVAPVERAVESPARMLRRASRARYRRPVVPALGTGIRLVPGHRGGEPREEVARAASRGSQGLGEGVLATIQSAGGSARSGVRSAAARVAGAV